MSVEDRFLLNKSVYFYPLQHRLQPIGDRGIEVVMNTPASRCLLLLLKKPGELVNQDEFFQEIWNSKGQYVAANTLYQNISLVRRALKSAGIDEDLIKTVPKEGIRFSGSVTLLEAELDVDQQYADPLVDPANSISADMSTEQGSEPRLPAIDSKSSSLSFELTLLVFFRKIKTGIWVTVFFISVIFFFYFTYILYLRGSENSYFSAYKKIGEINSCQVYARDTGVLNLRGKYLDFIKDNKQICGSGKIAYISADQTRPRFFVHVCNQDMEVISSCISRYYID